MRHACIGLFVCATLLAHGATAGAQVRITGAIPGTVTDMSDAVVPGAAVLLKDEGTGITKETVSVSIHLASYRQGRGCTEIGGGVV